MPLMYSRSIVVYGALLLVAIADGSVAKEVESTASVATDGCGLWLAVSGTNPTGESRLGLYAGRDYAVNETVGPADLAIPFMDWIEDWNRRDELSDGVLQMWESYLWTPDFAGNAKFEANNSATVLLPGLGVLAQYHSGFSNVDFEQSSVLLRDASPFLEAGRNHPSRGAITHYWNVTMKVTEPITAGMELFGNFGDMWDGNETEDVFAERLTRANYKEADMVLDKILGFLNKYEDQMDNQLKDDVLDFIMGKVLGTAAGTNAKAIRALIPAHPAKLQLVKDMGGTFSYRNQDFVRTKKWLKKHGVCVDNLEIKPSTIPEAGRGAFASRKIGKGELIAPMPLMHMADKDVANIWGTFEMENEHREMQTYINQHEFLGKQLVVNYGFSHPETSILLVPVTPATMAINHAPADKVNARVSWSKNKHWGNNFDFLDVYPEDMGQEMGINLVMDLHATRVIEEGEEIFIDYGEEWVKAWDTYYEDYLKKGPENWPLKAEDLNMAYKQKPFKTKKELRGVPYPKDVMTVCNVETREMTDGEPKKNEDGQEIALFARPSTISEMKGINVYGCTVIDRSEELDDGFLYNYTVIAGGGDSIVQVANVPHYAISFSDKPYKSDLHKANAFRHPIGLPDGMLPSTWRNRI